MGRICSITAAILVLTASWVCAGAFEVLAKADAARTPTPLHAAPGTVVKAEFRSDTEDPLEMRTESDTVPAEAAAAGPLVKPKPVVAYKERSARAMAPAPKANQRKEPAPVTVAKDEEKDSLEDELNELEKHLVISPPKGEARPEQVRPTVEPRSTPVKEKPREAVGEPKASPAKQKTQAVRTAPPKLDQYAQAIRKVRPVTANPWGTPAGAYRAPGYPPAMNQSHAAQDFNRITPPATTERFVRDGVTVKLAPRLGVENYPLYNDEYDRSDIVSAAVELIGMPFAFISSMF
ncbi:MAG: hypothetical protein LDL33_04315 [Desulfomonile sp.]|nr:hypothetical protein [Desulfomonile sp.]